MNKDKKNFNKKINFSLLKYKNICAFNILLNINKIKKYLDTIII
ncbi:MAG: hypothetical protein ABNO52_00565 [Candidatus Shikimatogenerans sp. Tser]|uniref:Uncharacterized protein n=1 Tax=Candidatus Shikimatogenerans sp. Tser TaxID=3158568 RepID=A0AAU7QS17_9FLAO